MSPIDIIVPVYRGLTETRRCIESVLAAPVKTDFELIVIDDRSPEPELVVYLDSLAAEKRITLLRNAENLGFVATVNRGMQLHPDRDVLLLNSDTEVANDWLDRMIRAAYSAADVGTVTPFSNNATIFSYPFPSCDPGSVQRVDLARVDRCFGRANSGQLMDVPTAVGFCMLIRRICLDAVGYFDVEAFGAGYGEECDFSRRAIRRNWRNVLASDVFVYHAGGVSFGEQRLERMGRAERMMASRHPDYALAVSEFSARDPLLPYRTAVDHCIFDECDDLRGRLFFAYVQRVAQMGVSERALVDERLALINEQRVLLQLLDEARSGFKETDAALGATQDALRQAQMIVLEQQSSIRELQRDMSALNERYRRLRAPLTWFASTWVGKVVEWFRNKISS